MPQPDTIEYLLQFSAGVIVLALLIFATRWLITHVDSIVEYRAPWLTMAEEWFVRIFWLAVVAAYLTSLRYAPDEATRMVLIVGAFAVLFLVLTYRGCLYWNERLKIKERYDAYHERNAVRTEFITFMILLAACAFMVLIPYLMLALPLLLLYGSVQYSVRKKEERDRKEALKRCAERFRLVLWENHGISSFVHVQERVSARIVRMLIELQHAEDLRRIEQWLIEDIVQAMEVDRIVVCEVTDKEGCADPDERTIVDVRLYYKKAPASSA